MGWIKNNGWLMRNFQFDDFSGALEFTNKVGAIAEYLNHHPNIKIHGYNQVEISTTTHDANNSITDKDLTLADSIDSIS
jgi:4a-hydroxytetrahydrobiopterin dehydratase